MKKLFKDAFAIIGYIVGLVGAIVYHLYNTWHHKY